MPDVLIELVGDEAHGADDGSCDEGIVDATEQLHNSLFFNNICYRPHHPVLRLHLHVHFNSIEEEARQAANHPRYCPAGKILKELDHP